MSWVKTNLKVWLVRRSLNQKDAGLGQAVRQDVEIWNLSPGGWFWAAVMRVFMKMAGSNSVVQGRADPASPAEATGHAEPPFLRLFQEPFLHVDTSILSLGK